MSSINSFEIHISRIDDHYHFIIEDPNNPITSFSEKIPVPPVSRQKILEKLKELLSQIGVFRESMKTALEGNTTREYALEILKAKIGETNSIVESMCYTMEKLGRLIFKYMVPVECRHRLCGIQSEHVIISTEDVEIPWELMHDGEEFFCLKYSVGRKIQAKVSIKRVDRPKSDKVRFLFISNPTLDLPKADEEVKQIIRFLTWMHDIDVVYINGEDATIENLLDVLEDKYFDVIHYAGHAVFNTKNLEYSAIKLYDGDLTAKYLLNIIDVPPRIVFMNACESANIYYLEYDGRLTGLASAFISAGVDAYIGTLWPVVDEIAADLAINFYNQLLNGETVSRALRNAKLEVKRKYNDPFTWAAFILYGDPLITLLRSKKERKIKNEPLRIELIEEIGEIREQFTRRIVFNKDQVSEAFNNVKRAFRRAKRNLGDRMNLKVVAQGVPILKETKDIIGKRIVLRNFTLIISGEKESAAKFLKELALIHILWYEGYDKVNDAVEDFLRRTEKDDPPHWWKVPGYIDDIKDIINK